MMISSFDIIAEKKKQDYIFYQKIKPQNREIVKNLILDFDLGNSLIKLIKENSSSYEKVKTAYKKFLLEREAYLTEMTENL
jgi:hypothetical protein